MPGSRPGPLPARDLAHVLEHTGAVWPELRGGRILVTGGTGFIGGWIVESLLRASDELGLGVRCVVLTRDGARFAAEAPHVSGHAAVEVVTGDVRGLDDGIGECSHILHLATESGPDLTPSGSFWTAVLGTQRVLEFAGAHRVQKMLYVSSGAVYGVQPRDLDRIPEGYGGAPDAGDPSTGYGQGKRSAEYLCATANDATINVTIARPFAFVGPRLPLDLNFAIGNFIRDAMSRDTIDVAGDGTPRRSYLYAADLTVWLWTILVRGKGGRAYNVGSEDDLSIAELASVVADTLSPGKPIRIATAASSDEPPSRYVPSTKRASTELGLRQRVTLADGIRRTADWYVP